MFTTRLFRPSILLSSKFTTPSRNLSLKPRLPKFKLPNLKLTPEAPGNVLDSVNDAYVPPPGDISKGSFHWLYERIVILGMTPLVIFPFIAGVDYPLIDATMSTLILIHSRYGFQSCIIDYFPLRRFGNWHKIVMFLLNIGTCISLYGIYVIETEFNGLCDLIEKLWHA
jgi:succinate dehydrogenase hydrophobic anchor subunit